MMQGDNLMDFAADLLVRAGEIPRAHFRRTETEFKGDGTEVTEADRATERWIRQALQERFPDDGILGEEAGERASRSGRRWIVDPIDGTRSFCSGVPLYGMLLALEVEGTTTLGCCHFPELEETIVAARGAGAWWNGRRARVSACDDLGAARLVSAGWEYWRDRGTEPMRRGAVRLADAVRFARTWGDCFGYALVATGRAEILADPISGALWDLAPMLPILEEAGGRFTTFRGEPVTAWSTALASNGRLHEAAARLLLG
jgi:histidinol phosphatase-like enzyme (inositol monophosphatase family)